MKQQSLTTAAQIAVAALVLLGMVGGSLIVAHGGYETSPRRGGSPVFVPAPQGFIIAAMMYGMSVLGVVALLREWHQSRTTITIAIALYAIMAVIFVSAFGRI
jgi:hypothetical protein